MKKCKLGDIAEFRNGVNYSKGEQGYSYKCIGVTDFSQEYVMSQFEECAKVELDNAINSDYILEDGDILLVRSNGNKNLIGRSMMVFPKDEKVIYSGFCIRCRITSESVYPAYVLFILKDALVKGRFAKNQQTNINNINQTVLSDLEIMLPDYSLQKKIADILLAFTNKIEQNKLMLEVLESMSKTLYDYWFVQFDFPDENGHPYKTSGGKMEWNETLSREIPAGWEVGRLADYCSLQRGVTYGKGDSTNIPQDGYEPILRANNIQNHELNFDSLVYLPKKLINEKQYLKNGDILIAMSSGSMEHIGKVARVFYELNYGFGAFCSKITPLKDTGKQYVYYYVISDEFQLYIHNMCLGTNIRNLTNDHILNSKLCKIPEKILSQFESKMAPIHKKQALLKQENINLSYIRDFLLPMLMNGQVTFRQ